MPTTEAVTSAIETFPEPGRDALAKLLLAEGFCGVIPAEAVARLTGSMQTTPEQLMLALVELARLYARPPISTYHVGAIAQGLSGALYFGANLEFVGPGLGLTIHGEQSAISHAWLHGETGLTALAVGGTPCGHCRQFMGELITANELTIVTPRFGALPLTALLPHAFGPQSLGHPGGLLQTDDHQLRLLTPTSDPLTLAALAMANRSYAPYSRSYAGAALLTRTGQIFSGAYAENAAFNPSLPPLAVALSHLNLAGQTPAEIERAVLVELEGALCSQVVTGQALLGPVRLEVVYAGVGEG